MPKRIFFSISILLILACNDKLTHSEFQANPGGIWSKSDAKEFSFTENDTISANDIFISIRNDESFPYSNLFLIADLKYPNGDIQRDTMEYEMAMPDGKWLGKGYGSIKENKLWYKENIIFPVKGVYTLQISHAMRKNGNADGIMELEGITDVGFLIEKRK
ncbi:MAG: gliding motility lipoprotein GldH [Eudoraea sp.]|uniref:gliding motility lipoprotein GldH n=1 Tax=Eudoraea sp. TaxID=1979955 RepID=UPI003264B274